jgi:hypothetical protein
MADKDQKADAIWNLTADAIKYWEFGWRVGRAALVFPLILRFSQWLSPYSISNWLSAITVAHAMRNGAAAEYGVLVMTFHE